MSPEKILYTARAAAHGGRDGRAVSSDQALDVHLSTPRELGGPGGSGTNPEQRTQRLRRRKQLPAT